MKIFGINVLLLCSCITPITLDDELQKKIQESIDKELRIQAEKKVIHVDKVIKKHVLNNVWIRDKGAANTRRYVREHDKPNIKWFGQDMKLNFPTSNKLNHPFDIRRAPIPTVGMPWPKPQTFTASSKILYRLSKLYVKGNLSSCAILAKAVQRYETIFYTCNNVQFTNNLLYLQNANFSFSLPKPNLPYLKSLKYLTVLSIDVKRCPNYPILTSDESYILRTSNREIKIEANEVWGALRALETLSQLIICIDNYFIIRETRIIDFPRFPHRGILIDSARHFMSKKTIFQMLSAMEMNKMNVLHWHLTDDQSFPYQSQRFPELSRKGAYHPSLTYTPDDVAEIVEFARIRGIRVIPEFDTPGHSFSWGYGHPELLTQCFDKGRLIPGHLGPMNPARNNTYTFLTAFFKEILDVFKDQYVHLGNDEVPTGCWISNEEVQRFISKINDQAHFKTQEIGAWNFFTKKLISSIRKIANERENGVKFILWQEAFQSNLNIPIDSIVQVWLGRQDLVAKVTNRGHHALYSSCWYINMIEYGVVWPKYYLCDPVGDSFAGNPDLVLGGEACLWTEYITSESAVSLLWPKASAVAERLWSDKSLRDINEAAPRLEEQRCRMLRRNLPVGDINGPGFCAFESENKRKLSGNILKGQQSYFTQNTNIQELFWISASLVAFGIFLMSFFTCKSCSKKCRQFRTLRRLCCR